MKFKKYNFLRLLLPMALLLLFLLVHDWQQNETNLSSATITHEVDTETLQNNPDPSQAPRTAAISPTTIPLWNVSDTSMGSANGLRPAFAAASRGKNELPEGRRWKLENFPDLRSLKEGQRVTVPLPDGRLMPGKVVWSRKDEGYADTHMVSIAFDDRLGGLVAIHDGVTHRNQGRVIRVKEEIAWTFNEADSDPIWLRERRRSDLMCNLPTAAVRSNPLPNDPNVLQTNIPEAPFIPQPQLNSRPEAIAALYLDFDGDERTIYPDWTPWMPIDEAKIGRSKLNTEQITKVWRRVAEDFIQFQVNVTTDPAKYDAAPVGKRMRVIIGYEHPAGINGPGWALGQSFQPNSVSGMSYASNVPCFVEVQSYGDPTAGMNDRQFSSLASNISHEIGHTMGLAHDGWLGPPIEGYYKGHGVSPYEWGSIMGNPYVSVGGSNAKDMIQWSKGEYLGANNPEDDLAIIAGPANDIGYAADESTGLGNASNVTTVSANRMGGEGVIANQTDKDWWSFTVTHASTVSIEVTPADMAVCLSNLDCQFSIQDASGTELAGGPYDAANNLEAAVTAMLSPGTYYIVVSGQGNGGGFPTVSNTGLTGYSAYGSTGRYLVTVDLPPDVDAPQVAITSPANGSELISSTVNFSGTAIDNVGIAGMWLYLRRNSDGVFWNGNSWQVGISGAALAYTLTGDQWVCTATLPPVGGSSNNALRGGEYSFFARGFDAGGLTTQVESVVTVDSTAPGVTIFTPVSGSTLGVPGLTFSGNVSDNTNLNYVVGYIRRNADNYFWNGSTWQSGSSGANLTCNLTPASPSTVSNWTCTSTLPSLGSALSVGSYSFIAIAVDNIGNQRQVDSVVSIDSTPPVTTVAGPAHSSIINSGSVPFNGTITDNAGVWRVVCFIRRQADYLYWDGTTWIVDPGAANLSSSYNSGAGTWSCTATLPQPGGTLENGVYNFIALGFDHAGNVHQSESIVTVDYHQTYVWNGSAGGAWENAGSWTPNGIPGADDYVLINNGGTVTNNAIRSVYGFRVTNGTMTSSAGNSLNFTNDSTWSGGAIGGVWNNAASSTIALNNTTVSSAPAGTVFNNYGLLRNDAGSTTLPIAIQQQENGRIQNNGSLLYLSGGGTHYPGSVLDAASGAIYLHGGTHTFEGGSFTGNNWIYSTGGTMLVQGNVGSTTGAATGSFGISGGTVTGTGMVSAQRGYFSTGTLSGSVVLRFTNSFTKPTNTVFNMNGGTLQIDGLFESPGAADFNLDSLSTAGAGTIHNKGIWRCSNAFTYSNTHDGGVFRNEGLFESLAGVSMIAAAFHSESGSTFRSKSGYVRLGGGGIHDPGSTFDADGGDIYFSAGMHQLLGGTFTGSTYVYATGATVSVEGNVGASSGAASGGFGIFAGTVTGTSMLSTERGIFQDGMTGGTVTIRLTGESSKVANSVLNMNGGTIRNEGTMTAASGGNFNLDSATGDGAGTIVNTGIWRCSNVFTYSNTGGSGVFRNEGLFESLAGVSLIQGAFLSEAGSTFRSKDGYVRLNGGGIHQPGSIFDVDGGDIYYSGGTHQLLGGTYTGAGYVYATGGTVSVEGNVGASSGAATGGFGISSGTVIGTGMISVDHGIFSSGNIGGTVTVRLTGASNKTTNTLNMSGGTIRNEGTMTQPVSSDFNLDSSSSEGGGTLLNSGIWNQTGSSAFLNSSGGGQIDNYGLWHISAGNSSNAAYFTHRANSIFRVTGGQMVFTGGGVMKAGSVIDTNGGYLYLSTGTHILEGGAITGSTYVYSSNGTTNVTGDVGTTSGAATGGYGITGGSLTGTAMISVDHGYFSSGNIGGTVTMRLTGDAYKASGTINMSGGTIRNEGTMAQPASGDFNLDSNASLGGGTLLNTGTWNQTGSSTFLNSSDGGQIDNYGLWHINAGNSSSAAFFTHRANSIFRVTGGQMIFTGGGVMKAGSTVDADGGAVYFNGGTQTLEGGVITGASTVYCGIGSTNVTGDVGATSGPATGGFGIYNNTGHLSGTAMLSVDHGFLAGGSVSGSVTLRLTGASYKAIGTISMSGGTIRNEGTMMQPVSGDFNLDSSSAVGGGTLLNTGTWNQTGASTFLNSNGGGQIDNYGLWHISAGNSSSDAFFTHQTNSIFRVTGGQMIFTGGGVMKAGSTVDADGGAVYFNGGTQTLEGGAITGANTIYCGIGSTNVTGDVGATSGPATGGFGIYNNIGTLIGSAMLSVDHGYLAAGNIGGTVILRCTGTSQKITNTVLNMTGGTIRNDGTMNVAVSGDFNLDSNSGAGGGSIVNNGTWNHAGSCNINNTNLGGSIQNTGTFQINAGTTQIYAPFNNSGLTRVAAGSLFLRAGSLHTGGLVSNGSLTFIGSGHSLSGSNAFIGGTGSFSGNATLTNAASIAPGNSPGTLSLFGTMQFLASTEAPSVRMELASASQFDQIVLGNGASLALGTGVTDLLLDLQYQPTPGQTFRLISAGTSTGSFSGRFRNAASSGDLVTATYQGIPYQFRVNYDPSNKFIDLIYQSGYQLWIAQKNLAGGDAAFDADPDGDGISNGIEFIIGGDPRPGFPDTTPHPNQNNPVIDETYLIYSHRRSLASRYLSTSVEYNSTLAATWSQAEHGVNGVVINISEEFYGAGIDKVEVKIPRSLTIDSRMFVRLQSQE